MWANAMCRSIVYIHSATAEIRRGKKKEEKKKPQGKDIMTASATQGGRNNRNLLFTENNGSDRQRKQI